MVRVEFHQIRFGRKEHSGTLAEKRVGMIPQMAPGSAQRTKIGLQSEPTLARKHTIGQFGLHICLHKLPTAWCISSHLGALQGETWPERPETKTPLQKQCVFHLLS